MSDRPAGLRRDAAILLRYRWFILIVLGVALAGALIIGITRTPGHEVGATVEARPTQQGPVFGVTPTFVFDDYEALASSKEVARSAADLVVEQGLSVSSDTLAGRISRAEVTPPGLRAFGVRQIEFTARDGDESKARAYAEAWAAAYVEEAEALRDQRLNDHIANLESRSAAAAADLDEQQQTLDDFHRQHPDIAPVSLSALAEERGRVTRGLARLKVIQAQGQVSPNELRIALTDLFPDNSPPPAVDLPTMIGGLGLRLNALNSEIAAYQGRNALADQAQQLLAEAKLAEQAYASALGQASAARALRDVGTVGFRVVKTETKSDSLRLDAVGLLAAAAAFGLAVGVVGAFAIEFVARTRPLPWQHDPGPGAEGP